MRITAFGINETVREYVNQGACVAFDLDGHLLVITEPDGAGEILVSARLPRCVAAAMTLSPRVNRTQGPLCRRSTPRFIG
jgi:hypothetical protein